MEVLNKKEQEKEETLAAEDSKKSISFWNKLLIAVLVAIVGLLGLAFYINYENEREMDLSFPYEIELEEQESYSTTELFASDLVVSYNYQAYEDLELSSSSEKALLFEIDNNTAIFAQGIYDLAYPASLTKIMTSILAIKYGNMDDTVTMQESDFDLMTGAQLSNMIAGDVVTLEQLVKLNLVYSANDASNAIARHISGSVEAFVELMNEEAQQLGMLGTHFTNPHGLHDDDHYTCAYDVYLMLNEAIKYSLFNETIQLSYYNLVVTRGESVISYYYDSTDQYMTGLKNAPDGVILWGGKTGTTSEAGSCLALIAQNTEGIPYIAVIMNCTGSTTLYNDMNTLLSYIAG